MNKICNKCGEEKALSEFYKSKDGRQGVRAVCSVCMNLATKVYAAANKERIQAYRRVYNDKNRGRHHEYYEGNKERILKRVKDRYEVKKEELKEYHRNYNKTEKGREVSSRALMKQNLKYPEKALARRLLLEAVRYNKIDKPNMCSNCKRVYADKKYIHGHHEDYAKPLDVVWLCVQCHSDVHNNKLVLNKENNK